MKQERKRSRGSQDSLDKKAFGRREFLIGGAMAASALAIPGSSFAKEKLEFLQSRCGEDKKDARKILVAYASKYGTTGEVADAIGKELCAAGACCEVRLVKEVVDLSPFQAVVIGGPARDFGWLEEATDFVKKNQDRLSKIPVAYFITCLQIVPGQPALTRKGKAPKDETEEDKRKRVREYFEPVLKEIPSVKPLEIGIFGGTLFFDRLNTTDRTVMKAVGFKEGDFRNYDAIRGWAKNLAPKLMGA